MSNEEPDNRLMRVHTEIVESPEWQVIKDQIKEMSLYVVFILSISLFDLLMTLLGISPPSPIYTAFISHVQWAFICIMLAYMSFCTIKKTILTDWF